MKNDYWKEFWAKASLETSRFSQVQRAESEIIPIISYLKETLSLQPTDSLLDVCCGNGLITKELSPFCQSVVGVDFSEQLILHANKEAPKNVQYLVGDALALEQVVDKRFDKIILHFSFQYFNQKQGEEVIKSLANYLAPKGKIFLGDIPDANRFWSFYNTFWKRFFYFKQYLFGKPQMGVFWSSKALDKMAYSLGLNGVSLQQPSYLPHSHYRFDYLLEKKD